MSSDRPARGCPHRAGPRRGVLAGPAAARRTGCPARLPGMSDRSSVDPLTPDLIARPCIHCGDPLGKSGDCPSCRRAERPAWEADPPTWESIERTSPFCRMGYLAAELYRTCLPDAPPVPAGNDIRVTIARRWDGAMDEA